MDQHSRRFRLLGLSLLLAAGPGCFDTTGPEAVTLAAMEGHWKATSLRYRDIADTTLSLDVVTGRQQTVDLIVHPGAAYSRLDSFPLFVVVRYDTGTVVLAGRRVEFASDVQDTLSSNVSFDGGRLVLTDTVPAGVFCPPQCSNPVEVRYRFRRLGL